VKIAEERYKKVGCPADREKIREERNDIKLHQASSFNKILANSRPHTHL
jgi:hypothetical protein